jgi:hypothetical protein
MAQLGLGAATALAMPALAVVVGGVAMPALAVVLGTATGTPYPPQLRLEGVTVREVFGRDQHQLPSLIKGGLAQVAQLCLTCAWLHT